MNSQDGYVLAPIDPHAPSRADRGELGYRRGMGTKLTAALVATSLTGCSLMMVRGPRDDAPVSEVPRCTTHARIPIGLDITWALVLMAAGLAGASSNDPNQAQSDKDAQAAAGIAVAGVGALFATSAVIGFRRADSCADAWNAYERSPADNVARAQVETSNPPARGAGWLCTRHPLGFSGCRRTRAECEQIADGMRAQGDAMGPCFPQAVASCFQETATLTGATTEQCFGEASSCEEALARAKARTMDAHVSARCFSVE